MWTRGSEVLANRPLRGDRGARASRVRRGDCSHASRAAAAIPRTSAAPWRPRRSRAIIRQFTSDEWCAIPCGRGTRGPAASSRPPPGGAGARRRARGKTDPLDAAAQRRQVVLPAVRLFRWAASISIAAPAISFRRHGIPVILPVASIRATSRATTRRSRNRPALRCTPGSRHRTPPGNDAGPGEKTIFPRGEAVGVGRGDRDPEISRGQLAAPRRNGRTATRCGPRWRRSPSSRPDQEVQGVDIEGPPAMSTRLGTTPEGAKCADAVRCHAIPFYHGRPVASRTIFPLRIGRRAVI